METPYIPITLHCRRFFLVDPLAKLLWKVQKHAFTGGNMKRTFTDYQGLWDLDIMKQDRRNIPLLYHCDDTSHSLYKNISNSKKVTSPLFFSCLTALLGLY